MISSLMKRSEIKDKRKFDEKMKAYTRLLNFLHKAALENSESAAKGYALGQAHVELVGSPDVIKHTQEMTETNPGTSERRKVFNSLIVAMRNDLDIDLRDFTKENR